MGFYKILASSYRLTNIFSSKNVRKIILFVLIGLCLFLLFSSNSFAVDYDSLTTLDNASISGGTINSNSSSYIQYFKTNPNYIYHIHMNYNSYLYYSSVEPSTA